MNGNATLHDVFEHVAGASKLFLTSGTRLWIGASLILIALPPPSFTYLAVLGVVALGLYLAKTKGEAKGGA